MVAHYAIADGTATVADHDYVRASGPLRFALSETTRTITIVVKGGRKKDAEETFFVNLSACAQRGQTRMAWT